MQMEGRKNRSEGEVEEEIGGGRRKGVEGGDKRTSRRRNKKKEEDEEEQVEGVGLGIAGQVKMVADEEMKRRGRRKRK